MARSAKVSPMPIRLDTPVQFLKGVGPGRGEILTKAGFEQAQDLLYHVPFRYEDRTNFKRIVDLRPDEHAVVHGEIFVSGVRTTARKRVRLFQAKIGDGSGFLLATFFNQPYLEDVLTKGRRVIIYGVTQFDDYTRGLSMVNPEYEFVEGEAESSIHTGRIVPMYRKIGQLTSKALRQIIHQALDDLEEEIPERLPPEVVKRHDFPGPRQAVEQIHFPPWPAGSRQSSFLDDLNLFRTPVQQRLIFEEFFDFQMGLQLIRRDRHILRKERRIQTTSEIRETLKSVLPFRPTKAQVRVLKEIVDDLRNPEVMSRLLQGDVGSGKTIVALQAMVVVMQNGYQTVLMAPTEILAEQHFKTLTRLLKDTPFSTEFLTSRVKGAERKSALKRIRGGQAQLIVGTHALIEKGVEFDRLGLVVVDEQHRFGVMQRSALISKGSHPDVLVMTATPIPRSLALTVYGDLDVSIIDEMPPGRLPIQTLVNREKSRSRIYAGLKRQLNEGRQVYVVYPLIEESQKTDLKAASEMARHLQEDVFKDRRVGLLHGKLKAEAKENLMAEFAAGEIDLLVSTTVIEVGIDVPNATVMVIENAERFGLSQLHQLRGRIGRGKHASYCVLLVSGKATPEARERLEMMRRSNDGFQIAEKDLEIRGPGEFLGTRQSGIPHFRFGNIVRDQKLLQLARDAAQKHLAMLLASSGPAQEAIIQELKELWQHRYGLYNVG